MQVGGVVLEARWLRVRVLTDLNLSRRVDREHDPRNCSGNCHAPQNPLQVLDIDSEAPS